MLEKKPPELQVIFLWICHFANDEGQCFPSRSALAKKCGVSVRTVDKYIIQLIELGLIEKTKRRKRGSVENTSNLYQVVLLSAPPSANNNTTPSAGDIPITISNINYTNLTTNDKITLNEKQGKTPTARLQSLYGKYFKHTYGFYPKAQYGSLGKCFKDLLSHYSEIQIAALLIVFFNWQGMDDRNPSEKKWLVDKAHSIWLFKSNASTYEAYLRNYKDLSREFDDDEKLIVNVRSSIATLSTI